MRKRWMSGFLILIVAFAATGCSSGKDASADKGKLTGKDDPKKVLAEVDKFYEEEKLWGSEITTQSYYLDGSQEEQGTMTMVVDNEKGVSQTTTKLGEKIIFDSFTEKKGEEVYYYVQEEGKDWIRYKTEKEEEASEDGLIYSNDYYTDVKYTNEGEEKLDGVDTVKIKATAVQETGDGEPVTTREEVIAENNWSEEAVAAVEGFSEMLDAYVDAQNALTSSGNSTCEYLIWVDVNTHRPVKSQETSFMEHTDDSALDETEDAMWDASWEVSVIANNMAEGMSLEEAKEIVEIDRADIEADMAALKEEKAESEGESEDEKVQDKYVMTEKVLLGKDCPKLGELPEKYKEITQEQYMNGDY